MHKIYTNSIHSIVQHERFVKTHPLPIKKVLLAGSFQRRENHSFGMMWFLVVCTCSCGCFMSMYKWAALIRPMDYEKISVLGGWETWGMEMRWSYFTAFIKFLTHLKNINNLKMKIWDWHKNSHRDRMSWVYFNTLSIKTVGGFEGGFE